MLVFSFTANLMLLKWRAAVNECNCQTLKREQKKRKHSDNECVQWHFGVRVCNL